MAPLTRAPEPGPTEGPGPWFAAGRAGACSVCGTDFDKGDQIRADGYGSWEGRGCQHRHYEVDRPSRFDGASDEEMGF